MSEKISALMDAELSTPETQAAFRLLSADPSQRDTWERFHILRAAMRNEAVYIVPDLAQRIAASLAADPVTPFRRRQFSRHTLYKGITGLALAATVAAVSITGIRLLLPSAQQQPQLAAVPAPHAIAPVAVAAIPRRGIHWDTHQPEMENTLNAYLVQHSEFTPTSGMGVMSYVRIAGYDSAGSSKE